MKLNAYTLFDTKSLQYHSPFFTHTDGAAVRMLQDLVGDTNTNVGRHPADYVLYCCGTYEDSNAQLYPEQPLRHVMDAIALVTLKPTGDLFEKK